jgi:cutinase
MRFFLVLASFTILVRAFPSPINSEVNKNGTLDDLVKRQLFGGGQVSCGPVAVIYCKGTFEPTGYGIVVGNQFTAGLQAVLPRGTQFHSVDYSNGVVGYLTGGALDGISTMKSLAESYSSKCPGIKIVMSGYRYVIITGNKAGYDEVVMHHMKC